jgi:hypothetical protein
MNKQICLSLDQLWFEKLEKLSKIYGLSKQEIIKIKIGELIGLLPRNNCVAEKVVPESK